MLSGQPNELVRYIMLNLLAESLFGVSKMVILVVTVCKSVSVGFALSAEFRETVVEMFCFCSNSEQFVLVLVVDDFWRRELSVVAVYR